MPASKSRKARANVAPEPTARPKSIADESALWARHNFGMSVDSDELAARFLSEATEQRNFESLQNQPLELSLVEGPAGDGPLVGPSYDSDRSVWEQTVGFSADADVWGASEHRSIDMRSPRDADDADANDEADDYDEEDETAVSLDERDNLRASMPAFVEKFDDDEAWRVAVRTGRTL